MAQPSVVSVSCNSQHAISKVPSQEITLVAGIGVAGDAHAGATVQHLARKRRDPSQPNLRQVHLLHSELLAVLVNDGFKVAPALMGENITTIGVELLKLPTGTLLNIGSAAQLRLTGLRNPCKQLEAIQAGLMAAVLDRDSGGEGVRLSGVMAIVVKGGPVRPGDPIEVVLPQPPHQKLAPV